MMELNCQMWDISHITLNSFDPFPNGNPCNVLTLHLANPSIQVAGKPYEGRIQFYNVKLELAQALLLAAPQPTQETISYENTSPA